MAPDLRTPRSPAAAPRPAAVRAGAGRPPSPTGPQVLHHLDLPLDEAVAESNALMADSLRRPDFAEGVASFVERRPPRFEPLSG
jgi:enoyl-CoA hydratase/carnithine racemase